MAEPAETCNGQRDPPESEGQAAAALEAPPDAGVPPPAQPSSLGALGLDIPWHERLSTRLFAATGLVAFLTMLAIFLAAVAVQQHLLAQVVEESDLVSKTIRNALHRAMLQDRRDEAYAIMEDIARQPEIERIRLTDQSGRVTFSRSQCGSGPNCTDEAPVGTRIDVKSEGCRACHNDGVPRGSVALAERKRVFTTGDGHRALGILTPIHNEPSCSTSECHAHPAARSVLGVLDVGISMEQLDRETEAFRRRALGAAAVAAVLLGLLIAWVARRQLIRPVVALVHATRRVASDQLETEIPITWSGELGALATSFNEMTRSLRQARAELQDLMVGLEQQVQDRTAALRTAQDQLVRSEKLSSLGRLSASIAHEINNPLAGILTFAKLMIRTLEQGLPDEPTRRSLVKHLSLVQRETERCTAIVRNLLEFARERPLAVKDVDINAVVEEALQLLQNPIQLNDLRLTKALAPLPPVRADFGQLRQACVNVIMNACEALPRGGRLSVESRVVTGGGAVELFFQDDGPGIPPERLPRIFDPFFTTKEKGTGLGLSVVYGIVERHGGTIDIRSAPGQGTSVTIRIPAGRPAAVAGEKARG
ncbi:MAG TPA: ATP-binding protein [Anaeromyxobacter sp.]|nr:ATP-binding protein [Anaeromyxobacter sp.]